MDRFKWTEEYDQYLRNYWKILPSRLIADRIGAKDEWVVIRRARRLGICKQFWKRFSKDEIKILKELYPTTSNIVLADLLSRNAESIQNKASKMGLKKSDEFIRVVRKLNAFGRHKAIAYPP